MTPTLYKYDNTKDYALDAASAIEDFIAFKLEGKESVKIALSGGQSPIPVYKALIKNGRVEWDKVELFMVDERYVPPQSDESNFRMLENEILSKINLLKFFHGFHTEQPMEEAAAEYNILLSDMKQPLFDLVLLGFGKDGHTASLFPKSPALKESKKLAVHTQAPDKSYRLTLTCPAILSSEKIMFLIQGKDKEELVEKWAAEDASAAALPATRILEHENVEVYYSY
jgi:6-phosphogluconolactonase